MHHTGDRWIAFIITLFISIWFVLYLSFIFFSQELERLAEMAKLDQLSDAKRRMKRLEHGRAVEAMIEDRRRRRAEEMAQLVESHKQEQDREKIKSV